MGELSPGTAPWSISAHRNGMGSAISPTDGRPSRPAACAPTPGPGCATEECAYGLASLAAERADAGKLHAPQPLRPHQPCHGGDPVRGPVPLPPAHQPRLRPRNPGRRRRHPLPPGPAALLHDRSRPIDSAMPDRALPMVEARLWAWPSSMRSKHRPLTMRAWVPLALQRPRRVTAPGPLTCCSQRFTIRGPARSG